MIFTLLLASTLLLPQPPVSDPSAEWPTMVEWQDERILIGGPTEIGLASELAAILMTDDGRSFCPGWKVKKEAESEDEPAAFSLSLPPKDVDFWRFYVGRAGGEGHLVVVGESARCLREAMSHSPLTKLRNDWAGDPMGWFSTVGHVVCTLSDEHDDSACALWTNPFELVPGQFDEWEKEDPGSICQ